MNRYFSEIELRSIVTSMVAVDWMSLRLFWKD
jgi:hypothetical protein